MTTTNFKARAYRSGNWWAIEITDGLPDDMLGVTQAKRLDKAEEAAREVLADLLEINAGEITVEMHYDTPVGVKSAQRTLEKAMTHAADAAELEHSARRGVVAAAMAEGLTQREIALILGISHQRVAQLA
ncbi:MAG: hypothetical protein AAGA37_19990 [Actinomycetota bacterium]